MSRLLSSSTAKAKDVPRQIRDSPAFLLYSLMCPPVQKKKKNLLIYEFLFPVENYCKHVMTLEQGI